jgi:hypothetical protein
MLGVILTAVASFLRLYLFLRASMIVSLAGFIPKRLPAALTAAMKNAPMVTAKGRWSR